MPLFDFHVHPAMKQTFKSSATAEDLLVLIGKKDISAGIKCAAGEGYKAFTSQVNYSIIRNNPFLNSGGVVIGHALYSIEKVILEGLLKALSPFGNRINKPFGSQFEYEKLEKALAMKDGFRPIDWTLESYYLNKKYKEEGWIQSIKDVNSLDSIPDGTIIEFYGVEGSHSIANHIDPSLIKSSEIIENLGKLILEHKIPILHFMVVHLEQNPLANHAYGMQFIDTKGPSRFKPSGETFTQGAKDIISFCQENKIHIDVKHMGQATREVFYKYWLTLPNRLPVISSHSGIAGIKIAEYKKYIIETMPVSGNQSVGIRLAKPWKYTRYASFNPSAINLFDEDIEFIINSGGIIGISLDLRVIGASKPPNKKEEDEYPYPFEVDYLAVKDIVNPEVKGFFGGKKIGVNSIDELEFMKLLTWEQLSDSTSFSNSQYDYHMNSFVSQIIHVMQVAINNCGKSQREALEYVCIGSDMEGIISAIYPLERYSEFGPAFERDFCDAFKFVWEEGVQEEAIGQKLHIPMKEIFNHFTFINGFNFVKRWLQYF